MKTTKIAAAQTVEFREDIDGALACAVEIARDAAAAGADLLCFPEGYLQGYLTDEAAARRHALDLASPNFQAVLERLPADGPTIVMGMIEIENERLFNTAVVLANGALIGRYRKTHLLRREAIFQPGADAPVFEAGGLKWGSTSATTPTFRRPRRRSPRRARR